VNDNGEVQMTGLKRQNGEESFAHETVLESFEHILHFLSPDQQSEIHCLIICAIHLLTPNNLGGT